MTATAHCDGRVLGPPGPGRRGLGRVPGGKRSTQGSVPVHEQAHQLLTLLGSPAAPKPDSPVYEAFSGEPLVATKLASLRLDEGHSFNTQGYTRP